MHRVIIHHDNYSTRWTHRYESQGDPPHAETIEMIGRVAKWPSCERSSSLSGVGARATSSRRVTNVSGSLLPLLQPVEHATQPDLTFIEGWETRTAKPSHPFSP